MTTVSTNINHNIDEAEFKRVIAFTASLIKYQGKEYLDKLNALNKDYQIDNVKFISEKQLHEKLVEKV